jgi:hypothetical protein
MSWNLFAGSGDYKLISVIHYVILIWIKCRLIKMVYVSCYTSDRPTRSNTGGHMHLLIISQHSALLTSGVQSKQPTRLSLRSSSTIINLAVSKSQNLKLIKNCCKIFN